jgi:hypothetical protein
MSSPPTPAALLDFKIFPTELMINHAAVLSNHVQILISNERKHVVRSRRDILALAYWTLLFEHHQGILILLRNHSPSPAFALLRPFEEAFLNLFVTMFGDDNNVELISKGRFRPNFETIGKQIDEKLGHSTTTHNFGTWFKNRIDVLHGLTHGGLPQLNNQVSIKGSGDSREMDVVSSFSDDDIRSLVQQTMPTIFMAAAFVSEFLDYPAEYDLALKKFAEYVEFQKGAFARQADLDKLKPKDLS